MKKIKNVCKKIAEVLTVVIGYALMVCLFAGGLGVIGYIVALCIGGDTAALICTWIYKTYYVWLIKISTVTTLLCFIVIYLKGDADWKNPIKYWKEKLGKKKQNRTKEQKAEEQIDVSDTEKIK